MLRIKKEAPFTRTDLANFLTEAKIGNRMFFGGSLLRQPAFVSLKQESSGALKVIGDSTGADEIMNQSIFIGTFPGLTQEMIAYIVEEVGRFVRSV